jgi:hypothetical protein
VTTNPGLVGWNYGNGRVASFSNCMGIEDLQNNNYNQLVQNICKWLTKSKTSPQITILTTENNIADGVLSNCLSNITSNIYIINQTFYNYNGLNLSNTDLLIMPASYNWTKGNDLSISVQNDIVNFINNGGGLLTAEWLMWVAAARNSMQNLRKTFPVNPTTPWVSRTQLRFTKTTDDPIVSNNLPQTWTWVPANVAGVETFFTSLKAGAIVFYTSSPLN